MFRCLGELENDLCHNNPVDLILKQQEVFSVVFAEDISSIDEKLGHEEEDEHGIMEVSETIPEYF